ncbi:MAG: proline--tRNA ligase [Spirochaetota bacterium]|nr:proline--tRNA ligase [Spirochaetota bacterium]
MRLSKYILPTLKEDPSDAVVISHRLMIRAGLIRKESAGMYIYLPLGLRVLHKIIQIIREEMNRSGALEFLMPELTNADLWKESGRWSVMGPEMIRIKDRNEMEYAMAPTHEEAFTSVVRSLISSYRDLPLTVYQINTKFRDEIRPRFGVMRSKEFIMKDAYSFDMTENRLEASYQAMRKTYRNIFKRCGLSTIPVEADTGSMGGSDSEEFMVASDIGEEVIIICNSCGYQANQERAEYMRADNNTGDINPEELQIVDTPNVKTIDQLVSFFSCSPDRFLKSIIYVADDEPVMAVVPGSREVNELKLKNYIGATELSIAPDPIVEAVTSAPVGFAGPVNDFNLRTIFDISIKNIGNAITGANQRDKHYIGVNHGRDFEIKDEGDITIADEGDKCPKCKKPMISKKGIEVGHIFKLGYKYTESMNVTVLDEEGRALHPIMGCYGIGVNRTMAAIIDQHHDDKGIMWPISVAPFHLHLIGIFKNDEEKQMVDEIYSNIDDLGIDVLYDDRKVSPGYKFADADLVGIPVRVTIGKGYFKNGEIEVKARNSNDVKRLVKNEFIGFLEDLKKIIEDGDVSMQEMLEKML